MPPTSSGRGPAVYYLRPLSLDAERWLDKKLKNAPRRFSPVEVSPTEIERVIRDARAARLSCELDEGGRRWRTRLLRV